MQIVLYILINKIMSIKGDSMRVTKEETHTNMTFITKVKDIEKAVIYQKN